MSQRRSNHTVNPLEHNFEKGIPGFLTANAFSIAWTEYQSLMIKKLNSLVAGTDYEAKEMKHIILNSSRDPGQASIFNYASMAHNNEFFFQKLSPQKVKMPEQLKKALIESFGSIDTLRDEMLGTANAMFGPGFVWLVKADQPGMTNAFKVLATYSAGSPYPGAHWRRQDIDLNTAAGAADQAGIQVGRGYLENSAYGAGRLSPEAEQRLALPPGGINVNPVLCLNTWEHVWVPDYSVGLVGGGKAEYGAKWWDRINWDKVYQDANLETKKFKH
ncbi:putative 37S ribosomal protein [Cercophora scortea]|uniref:37S ribosomal protein n=1 Tax=Cercophora scortea TaxID=314031 RepID=A0AAE0J605_9PEZI|nr:putative 37S ribosomal protein [Cercophora scortea]